jgi:hypothetical protein
MRRVTKNIIVPNYPSLVTSATNRQFALGSGALSSKPTDAYPIFAYSSVPRSSRTKQRKGFISSLRERNEIINKNYQENKLRERRIVDTDLPDVLSAEDWMQPPWFEFHECVLASARAVYHGYPHSIKRRYPNAMSERLVLNVLEKRERPSHH